MTEEAQFPRLLERVREVMRLKHLSLKTEKSYLYYIRDFILFHNKRHPSRDGSVRNPPVSVSFSHRQAGGCLNLKCRSQCLAVDGSKSALRPDTTILKACKEIGGYQPVTWLAGRDKSRYPQVYRTHPLESSNYGAFDWMIGVANQKWREILLIARPAVQFRGFFPEVNNQNLTEIALEIKETYNDYLKSVRSLEDLKNRHPELREPYIEVTSTKSQRTIYLTRLDRFGTLESGFFSQDKQFPVDLQLVKNKIDREIPNSLLAVATLDLEGKSVEQPIGAIALSSVEEYNLKAGIKLTQGLASIRPGITQERIQGIYKALDEYVEMVRQEHPESERQQLAAALWHHAHTRGHQSSDLRFSPLITGNTPQLPLGNNYWQPEIRSFNITLCAFCQKNFFFAIKLHKKKIIVVGEIDSFTRLN